MKITFIQPGMISGKPSDAMEPIVFALLAAMTPESFCVNFYDARLESVPLDEDTDAIVLSIETYAARSAYQLAQSFRRRGIPVIAGGFHPTLCPQEAATFVDSIIIGDAEDTWPQVLADLEHHCLKPVYKSTYPQMGSIIPDRRIFAGKKYSPIHLVQFGRGCPFSCDFCAIHAFYGTALRHHPIDAFIRQLIPLRRQHLLITDDNLLYSPEIAKQLFAALKQLKIRWSCQISLNVTQHAELLKQMSDSGCSSVTVGFESLHPLNLKQIGKPVNRTETYVDAIKKFHDHGMMVYGTFVFGYDHDTPDIFKQTLDFALENRLFLANFNPLIPMPGTALYHRILAEKRFLFPTWWLDPNYRYGKVTFHPRGMSAAEMEEGCYWMRSEFNRYRSIAQRLINNRANRRSIYQSAVYLGTNLASHKEIHRKQSAPLGYSTLPHPEPAV